MPDDSMNSRVETITRKRAIEYMKSNVSNRPMREAIVRKYGQAMLAGKWEFNGDSIRFDETGRLIDGQKRLQAVIDTGVPIKTYVVRNLPPAAFHTIDQNQLRTAADQFSCVGHKNSAVLAAGTKWVAWYNGGDIHHATSRLDQLFDTLHNNPLLHTAAEEAMRLYRESRLLSPGPLTFLLFICGNGGRADSWSESLAFWESVMGGENLSKGTPAHTLRKKLVLNQTSTSKLFTRDVLMLGIKAWNFHREGQPCTALRWIQGEAYPIPLA